MALALPRYAADWAFLLDIDGTLLAHAERPDAVQADDAIIALLDALHAGSGGALALVSGRSIADIDRLFAPRRFAVAGQHGIERRDAANGLHHHAFPVESLRRVAIRLGEFAAVHGGVLLEDKGASLALHYRLAPQLAGAARSLVEIEARALGDGFEIQHGKMVLEIKPGGRDKGVAIEEFMLEAPFRGRTPLFIGDDATDEFGFEVVQRLGGIAIKVGPGASLARWRLADTGAVRAWLGEWASHYARPAGP
ncbi:MAG: trehalose-phosphatase [Betaproteobacteria bacterium]|nr:trehalose-phosphatase [Betaproteobacteria bacterium]